MVVALVACSPRIELGARCTSSSNCPSPLVCDDGRCRDECRAQRDCILGARCVFGADGVGSCSLEDDGCGDGAPCSAGQQCVDGTCFDPCDGTCPADGLCIDGNCVRRDISMPAPARARCGVDANCAEGERCTTFLESDPVCRRTCASEDECADAVGISRCVEMIETTGGTAVNVCSIPCEALSSDGCPAPDSCDLMLATSIDGSYPGILECRRAGTLGPGEEASLPTECARRVTNTPGPPSRCVALCARDDAGTTDCPDGTVCDIDVPALYLGERSYGDCL
jgi:hypothetical protein